MTVALRPATVKLMLIAAGVLLGLLAITLMIWPASAASHGAFVDAAKVAKVSAKAGKVAIAGKLRPLGVLWH